MPEPAMTQLAILTTYHGYTYYCALEHARAGNEAVGARVGALRDGPVGLDATVNLARG
jgi:hypothetical protein